MTLNGTNGVLLRKPSELRRHAEIGIAKADHVERIEGVHAEADKLFANDGEILEPRQVHIAEARAAYNPVHGVAEGVLRRHTEGTHAVINTGDGAGFRRGIRTEPGVPGPVDDVQRAVLFSPSHPITVDVAITASNRVRKPAVEHKSCANLPAADHLVDDPVRMVHVFASVTQ